MRFRSFQNWRCCSHCLILFLSLVRLNVNSSKTRLSIHFSSKHVHLMEEPAQLTFWIMVFVFARLSSTSNAEFPSRQPDKERNLILMDEHRRKWLTIKIMAEWKSFLQNDKTMLTCQTRTYLLLNFTFTLTHQFDVLPYLKFLS